MVSVFFLTAMATGYFTGIAARYPPQPLCGSSQLPAREGTKNQKEQDVVLFVARTSGPLHTSCSSSQSQYWPLLTPSLFVQLILFR